MTNVRTGPQAEYEAKLAADTAARRHVLEVAIAIVNAGSATDLRVKELAGLFKQYQKLRVAAGCLSDEIDMLAEDGIKAGFIGIHFDHPNEAPAAQLYEQAEGYFAEIASTVKALGYCGL